MSNKRTDISQIRKYLNGELDAHAMHQLEREAQDDPFLADALDGYEAATGLQQRQLNDLESMLQQRIDQRRTRRMPWLYISAAASLLLILTIAYLLWPSGQKAPVKLEANLITQPPTDHPVNAKADTVIPPAAQAMAGNAPGKAFKPAIPVVKADNQVVAMAQPKSGIRIDEPVGNSDVKAVTEDEVAKVKKEALANQGYPKAVVDTSLFVRKTRVLGDSTHALKEVTINGLARLSEKDIHDKAAAPHVLQGKVAGVQVTTPDRTVNGVILDQMGVPLPGVSILVKGTKIGAQTDANGKFSIPVMGNDATLDINYIGYTSQQVKARADDNLKIALKENTAALSEVVVTGYGTAKYNKPVKEAHPIMGMDSYNKYLKNRAIADDEKAGTVQLSFTVGEEGQLSDFKILKGLSESTNQQAIDLVKNGPAWAPDADGKPTTVKLKVKFSKE